MQNIFNWELRASGNKLDRLTMVYKLMDGEILAFYIPDKKMLSEAMRMSDDIENLTGLHRNLVGKSAIYFQFREKSGITTIYVGKTENGLTRAYNHLESRTESDRRNYEFWDSTLIFTSSSAEWDESIISGLEAIFIYAFQNFNTDKVVSLNSRREVRHLEKAIKPENRKNIATKISAIQSLLSSSTFGIPTASLNDVVNRLSNQVTNMSRDIQSQIEEANNTKETGSKSEAEVFYTKAKRYDRFRNIVAEGNEYIQLGRITPRGANDGIRIDEVITPDSAASDIISKIDIRLFNSETRFLDITCKSGVFLSKLLDILMSDDDRLPINHEKSEEIVDKQKRLIHIVKKQLFGIALTNESLLASNYNLAKTVDRHAKDIGNVSILSSFMEIPNIITITDYIGIIKSKNKSMGDKKEIILNNLRKALGVDVKFDVVIGNPPYQDTDGKRSIYPKFIELGTEIGEHVCMITKDNWINGEGELKKAREKMISTGLITDIVHYPVVGEVFDPSVAKVSVAYFHWKRGGKGETNYKVIRNGKLESEHLIDLSVDENGVIYKSDMAKAIIDKVQPNVGEWARQFGTRSYPFMDQRKFNRMDSSELPDEYYNVEVESNDGNSIYVNESNFSNLSEVYRYKVMCGVVINEASQGTPGNALTNIIALRPGVVGSHTWSLVALLDSEAECINCLKYVKTRFVRWLANQSVNQRANVTANIFKLVPVQDLTPNSEIDWSQPISMIDRQLYKKYNLSESEINYIESIIKPQN